MTGLTKIITRSQLEELLKDIQVKNTGSVSGKTNYLISGYQLEDGRDVSESSKYKKAKTLGTKILTELEFDDLLRDKVGMGLMELYENNFGSAKSHLEDLEQGYLQKQEALQANPLLSGGVLVPRAKLAKKSGGVEQPAPMDRPIAAAQPDPSQLMWTQKHAPKLLSEIIGNQEVIRDLMEWLKRWNDVFIKKTFRFPEKSKKVFIPGQWGPKIDPNRRYRT